MIWVYRLENTLGCSVKEVDLTSIKPCQKRVNLRGSLQKKKVKKFVWRVFYVQRFIHCVAELLEPFNNILKKSKMMHSSE